MLCIVHTFDFFLSSCLALLKKAPFCFPDLAAEAPYFFMVFALELYLMGTPSLIYGETTRHVRWVGLQGPAASRQSRDMMVDGLRRRPCCVKIGEKK